MNEDLKKLLAEDSNGSLDESIQASILNFYEIVLQENELQNLTRLTSPQDFYYGHLKDVFELLKTGKIEYPAMDLGSGAGIPGLVAAIIHPERWILAESEKRKAEYLEKTVNTLQMDTQNVRVVSIRAEKYLQSNQVGTIVARAVGPIDRIYSWLRDCSTWNNLLLLKGPGWSEEWNRFLLTKYRNELKIGFEHDYEVNSGEEIKTRKIIQLIRVPRGTKK